MDKGFYHKTFATAPSGPSKHQDATTYILQVPPTSRGISRGRIVCTADGSMGHPRHIGSVNKRFSSPAGSPWCPPGDSTINTIWERRIGVGALNGSSYFHLWQITRQVGVCGRLPAADTCDSLPWRSKAFTGETIAEEGVKDGLASPSWRNYLLQKQTSKKDEIKIFY